MNSMGILKSITLFLLIPSLWGQRQTPGVAAVMSHEHAIGKPWSVPQSTDLRETGPFQRRDLSIPGARIVLNPYNFRIPPGKVTAAEYSNRPDIPLHMGYLSTKAPDRELSDVLMIHKRNGRRGESLLGWQADLSTPVGWQHSGESVMQTGTEGLKIEVNRDAASEIQSFTTRVNLEINLDKTPYLHINVPEGNAWWAIKVHAEDEPVDRVIRQESPGNGLFTYNIAELTGWTGRKSFKLNFYVIQRGESVLVSDLSIGGVKNPLEKAADFQTDWQPHALSFTGTYSNGTVLYGTDFFYDEHTVVRTLSSGGDVGGEFVLSGKYHGSIQQKADSLLIIRTEDFSYAVCLNLPSATPVKYYSSFADMMAARNELTQAEDAGYWSVTFAMPESQDKSFAIAVAFAEPFEPLQTLRDRAHTPMKSTDRVESALNKRIAFWDQLLREVPHPADFHLSHVPALGVDVQQIKEAYYKAWVFLAMNVLASDPIAYPYPQIVTGKASLWAEGHRDAPFSAAWESFIGMQLYAYLDPQTSWAAFEGLMSLVDETGLLGGESLPSRKAQTALLLYRLTGNKDALLKNYAAMKRYMNWRLKYPQWIYKQISVLDPAKKDAEFVVSALLDLDYLKEIARVLNFPGEVREWDDKRKVLFEKYLEWFWETPQSNPVQLFMTDSGKRSAGHTVWVTTGLSVDLLEGEYLKSMIKLFRSDFDPERTFGGLTVPKYPDMGLTARGLLSKGHTETALKLIEVNIRDVVRAHAAFAEQYTIGDIPYPDGVRPSLFGMAQLIDFVLLKNGQDYTSGSLSFSESP